MAMPGVFHGMRSPPLIQCASTMSLYDKYKNEEAFRDQFVKPFLNRMGFFGVEEQHGAREFGKDFVFSELHRLGGMRHYAAQVKHEEKINQGKRSVDGLLSQIRQAFVMPFKRNDSPRDCHVSAVYVFNSGEITTNARDYMMSELKRERYGDNVHFLDGDRLQMLNESAVYRDEREILSRLHGLELQVTNNRILIRELQASNPDEGIITKGFFLSAVDAFLASPAPDSSRLTRALMAYWQRSTVVDSFRNQYFQANSVRLIRKQSEFFLTLLREMDKSSETILSEIAILTTRCQPIV